MFAYVNVNHAAPVTGLRTNLYLLVLVKPISRTYEYVHTYIVVPIYLLVLETRARTFVPIIIYTYYTSRYLCNVSRSTVELLVD